MKRNRLLATRVACAAISALILMPAHASVLTYRPYFMPSPFGVFAMASAGVSTGQGISPTAVTNYGVSPGTSQIVLKTGTGTAAQTANAFYAASTNNTASSFANASPGVIRISSEFVYDDAIPTATAVSYADAGWFETLTFSSPGLDGLPGQLNLIFHAEGTLFGGLPNGSASVMYAVASNNIHPELLIIASGQANNITHTNYSQSILQDHLVTVNFVWGQSFELLLRAVDRATPASLGGLTGSTGNIHFEHTLYWGGIQSVTALGNPVDIYTLTSASGTDYRNSFAPGAPVPEPGTLVLSGLALVLVGLLRRKHRARIQIVLPVVAGLTIGGAAWAQAIPGPVPNPGVWMRGDCDIEIRVGDGYGSNTCNITNPSIGPGLGPKTVPLGKLLIITDVSAHCKTWDGTSSGTFVTQVTITANGYIKRLPLVSTPEWSMWAVRAGTFPAYMAANSGSQVEVTAMQNKLTTGPYPTLCRVQFGGYLVNP